VSCCCRHCGALPGATPPKRHCGFTRCGCSRSWQHPGASCDHGCHVRLQPRCDLGLLRLGYCTLCCVDSTCNTGWRVDVHASSCGLPAIPLPPPHMTSAQLALWGWRVPFLLAALPTPIALLLRMHMVRCARLCWCSSPAACDLFPWCNDIQCSMDCSKTPT